MIYFLWDWNHSTQKSSSGNFNISSSFSFSEAPPEEESRFARYRETMKKLHLLILDLFSFMKIIKKKSKSNKYASGILT